jgi:hypothetical protein
VSVGAAPTHTGSYRQFRVPRESGRALIDPGLDQIRSTLRGIAADSSASERTKSGLEFCGQPLEMVRQEARQEALALAVRYTQVYRDVPAEMHSISPSTPLILSGHQPELFHAGVWFKNFLISQLARDTNAIAINFLVDNDLCRSTSIRVPGRTAEGDIVATSVPFDAPRDNIPWELRLLNDEDCWRSFVRNVREQLFDEIQHPLLEDLWPGAIDSIARTGRIGNAVAEARHRLEADLGLQTLEVPLSQLASTRAFARFSIRLLSELPRLQQVYNTQREIYRAAHNIRSHAHPVPPLEKNQGWWEAPWWVYRPEAPKRQRLWVRLTNEQLILSDRAGWQAVIEGRLECDNAASQWLEILSDGICLRPRALLTTMYLRIVVGDTFVHGIGGGKYDQLTDAIIEDFFAIPPMPFVVASATVHLPTVHLANAEPRPQQERERLWQLKYHAEAVLTDSAFTSQPTEVAEAIQLAERKQELLSNIPERGEKWKWHREITAVNRRLAELAVQQAADAKLRLDQATQRERQQRVIASREHSFCLFPLDYISDELKRLAAE